ncbi:MAG: hypothetical protein MZV63_57810 [Marinilabiliales bacterium]|nr:hypothetical protein [Marinilabiliales bacterium]
MPIRHGATSVCSCVFAAGFGRHDLRHPQVPVVHRPDRRGLPGHRGLLRDRRAPQAATRSARPSSRGPRTWSTRP